MGAFRSEGTSPVWPDQRRVIIMGVFLGAAVVVLLALLVSHH
jgi:hypothetical protein